MYRKFLVLLIVIAIGYIFSMLFLNYQMGELLPEISKNYVKHAKDEVGAANMVTAVIVTYRGLDTLGEVTILFLTAAIIGFFLKVEVNEKHSRREILHPSSEILLTASKVLMPMIFLVGAYIFINGHLTPGGGFQGGAVIASGFALMIMSNPFSKIRHGLIEFIESISGLSFIIIGVFGIFLANGFLDNRILPLGEFGQLISAGAVPLIYIFVGMKVGSELTNILAKLLETQNEQ